MTSPDRRTYLGSSDAATIMQSHSKVWTWEQLWEIKTGNDGGKYEQWQQEMDHKFNVQLGNHTEKFHVDWIFDKNVEEEIRGEVAYSRNVLYLAHAPHSFMGCHPDAIALLHDDDYALIETKHSSGARSIMDLVDFYMPQLQHAMHCTDTDQAYFSVIQGNKREAVWVSRSDDFLKPYIERAIEFWSYVKSGERPPHTPSPDVDYEKRVNAIPVDGMVRRDMTGNNEFAAVAADYIELAPKAAAFDKVKKHLKETFMPKDVSAAWNDDLMLKRSKAGSVLITVKKEKS